MMLQPPQLPYSLEAIRRHVQHARVPTLDEGLAYVKTVDARVASTVGALPDVAQVPLPRRGRDTGRDHARASLPRDHVPWEAMDRSTMHRLRVGGLALSAAALLVACGSTVIVQSVPVAPASSAGTWLGDSTVPLDVQLTGPAPLDLEVVLSDQRGNILGRCEEPPIVDGAPVHCRHLRPLPERGEFLIELRYLAADGAPESVRHAFSLGGDEHDVRVHAYFDLDASLSMLFATVLKKAPQEMRLVATGPSLGGEPPAMRFENDSAFAFRSGRDATIEQLVGDVWVEVMVLIVGRCGMYPPDPDTGPGGVFDVRSAAPVLAPGHYRATLTGFAFPPDAPPEIQVFDAPLHLLSATSMEFDIEDTLTEATERGRPEGEPVTDVHAHWHVTASPLTFPRPAGQLDAGQQGGANLASAPMVRSGAVLDDRLSEASPLRVFQVQLEVGETLDIQTYARCSRPPCNAALTVTITANPHAAPDRHTWGLVHRGGDRWSSQMRSLRADSSRIHWVYFTCDGECGGEVRFYSRVTVAPVAQKVPQ